MGETQSIYSYDSVGVREVWVYKEFLADHLRLRGYIPEEGRALVVRSRFRGADVFDVRSGVDFLGEASDAVQAFGVVAVA